MVGSIGLWWDCTSCTSCTMSLVLSACFLWFCAIVQNVQCFYKHVVYLLYALEGLYSPITQGTL